MKTSIFKTMNLALSLTFCLGLASCNKEDFYQKDFLENPYQEPPTSGTVDNGGHGGADSGTGSTQGGVDSGVNGGTSGSTTGSSTNGSSTGGTDGGVTGSTTSGSTTGSTTSGSTTGTVTGSTTSGATTGSTTGGVTGATTSGSTTGSTTSGSTTGSTTGGVTGATTSGSTTGSTTSGATTGSTTGGVSYVDQLEVFKQAASQTKKIDIVWIIDNSGSMADEQAALGTNFGIFVDDFITKDVDFKMGITNTDTSSSSKKGKMVSGADTKLTSAMAKKNEAQFKTDFKNLVKVGTSGSGYEKGLEASEGFMEKYASSFLRKDAYLAVVILSDEEDQSAKTVKQYTDYLKSFKNEAGLVKIYSIVDVGLSNRNAGSGYTVGYQRYADASSQTAGSVADIRSSFYTTLADMSESIIKLLDSFALAYDPIPGSLKVFVNGSRVNGYTYDSASRSIKFDQGSLPPVGAEVKVLYLKVK